ALIELFEGSDDRQPADELRDQAVGAEVFRLDRGQRSDALLAERNDVGAVVVARTEADLLRAHTALYHLFEPVKRSAADEQDVRGIYLDHILLRVLSSTFRRDARDGALDELEEGLLDPFA